MTSGTYPRLALVLSEQDLIEIERAALHAKIARFLLQYADPWQPRDEWGENTRKELDGQFLVVFDPHGRFESGMTARLFEEGTIPPGYAVLTFRANLDDMADVPCLPPSFED